MFAAPHLLLELGALHAAELKGQIVLLEGLLLGHVLLAAQVMLPLQGSTGRTW